MTDNTTIRVLLIEDDAVDALLARKMLADVNTTILVEHCPDLTRGLDRLREGGIDAVLLDLGLPESQGLDTLGLLLPQAGDMPVIVLTDLADQQRGREALRAGAQDYLAKEEIRGGLLIRAIVHSLERKKMENERERLMRDLQTAMAKVKRLSGLLPICASCKKIRDDNGYWHQIETYIHEHSEAEFSHGICQECMKKLYPEYCK